jgi:glycosyltransferase involved in cell wall biosynthesis
LGYYHADIGDNLRSINVLMGESVVILQEKKPLVSIGLPVFNNEKTLERALDSLLDQDYENIEIIASDDQSSDKSASILERYASTNPHLKVNNNEKNVGAHLNLLKVLKLSKGKYFVWASGDDYWYSTFVSTLIKALLENEGAIAAMCATKRVWDHGSRLEIATFSGNTGSERYNNFELAKSIIISKDKHGKITKNNLFIHGVLEKNKFYKSIKSLGCPFKERLLLCQLALAGEFIFVDKVLFEKSVSTLFKFKERNPNDAHSLMLNEKFHLVKDSYRLARSLIFSEIIPFRNKSKIFSLVSIFIFNQKNIGLRRRAKGIKQKLKRFFVNQ